MADFDSPGMSPLGAYLQSKLGVRAAAESEQRYYGFSTGFETIVDVFNDVDDLYFTIPTSGSTAARICKTNSDGNIVFSKSFNATESEGGQKVIVDVDTAYVATGGTSSGGFRPLNVFRYGKATGAPIPIRLVYSPDNSAAQVASLSLHLGVLYIAFNRSTTPFLLAISAAFTDTPPTSPVFFVGLPGTVTSGADIDTSTGDIWCLSHSGADAIISHIDATGGLIDAKKLDVATDQGNVDNAITIDSGVLYARLHDNSFPVKAYVVAIDLPTFSVLWSVHLDGVGQTNTGGLRRSIIVQAADNVYTLWRELSFGAIGVTSLKRADGTKVSDFRLRKKDDTATISKPLLLGISNDKVLVAGGAPGTPTLANTNGLIFKADASSSGASVTTIVDLGASLVTESVTLTAKTGISYSTFSSSDIATDSEDAEFEII